MKPLPLPPDKIIAHIQQYAGQRSIKQLAEDLNVCTATIHRYSKSEGYCIHRTKRMERDRKISQFILDNCKKMKVAEIAESVGLTPVSVYQRGIRLGVTFVKVTTVDEDLVKQINELKAQGLSVKEIKARIGASAFVIYNSINGKYSGEGKKQSEYFDYTEHENWLI